MKYWFLNFIIIIIDLKVHLALYSLVPFSLIALANTLLVLTMYARRRRSVANYTQQITHVTQQTTTTNTMSENKKLRNERMNQTLLLMTFAFIALTSPIACASFFFDTLFTTDYGNFIIVLFNCISFSYHGLNFIIMTFSNTMFRKEFFKIIFMRNEN